MRAGTTFVSSQSLSESTIGDSRWKLAEELGLLVEVRTLLNHIKEWISQSDDEMKGMMDWQLLSTPKFFRPVTIFSCWQAVNDAPIPTEVVRSAVALEFLHNVSLIIDDILDRSRFRRGRLSLHCRFGHLPALMASGYLTAGALKLTASDPLSVELLTELLQRLGVAECTQWRLRRHPLGVEDWRAIAGEDTGSMFEVCAGLGTRTGRLRRFGKLLGMLYHGCDDVADVRGTLALGGGGKEDIRDGILTLPAAIAVRDPSTAVLFRKGGSVAPEALAEKFRQALPEAEVYLDGIAHEAEEQARSNAPYPERLITLIRRTRALSNG